MIVVLNFGGQYCHLIAHRVRDLGVYSEVLPFDTSIDKIKQLNPEGIILSGGPSSVKDGPICSKEILNLNIPILGICYGHQLIAHLSGADITSTGKKEYGRKTLTVKEHGKLLHDIRDIEQVWMSHGDSVKNLNNDFKVLASTDTCEIAAYESKNLYGVQFHIEVVHTPCGNKVLKNFLFKICNASKDFDIGKLHLKIIEQIKEEVKDDHVLMGTSGGVDSTVAASLIHEAIGEKLHCVFVDTGLVRLNETEEVSDWFKQAKFKNFHAIDASEIFLTKLKGITDPEEKRKIIGHTFIEVFEKKAKELKAKYNIKFLGQGTIYPDRIESAQPSKEASKIKSHHNLTLPEKMDLKIIEPIKELYKDGVRKMGKELNVDEIILKRHPFPGPGLAIRILGEITKEKADILRQTDHIFIKALKDNNQYDKIWQAFAALLPVKSVGVMGDSRTYEYIITLRAVTSTDAMTADWAKIPTELLEKISNNIVNNVKGVNRVLYDITQKPPGTIEYE